MRYDEWLLSSSSRWTRWWLDGTPVWFLVDISRTMTSSCRHADVTNPTLQQLSYLLCSHYLLVHAGTFTYACYVMYVMLRMLCYVCYVMYVLLYMLCFACYVMHVMMLCCACYDVMLCMLCYVCYVTYAMLGLCRKPDRMPSINECRNLNSRLCDSIRLRVVLPGARAGECVLVQTNQRAATTSLSQQ
jgi:hypothetical protein